MPTPLENANSMIHQYLSHAHSEATSSIMNQHLSQMHQILDFNGKARALDRQISRKIKNTFNILYLMLKKVDGHEFQVLQFLKPTEGHKKTVTMLKKTLLGRWLEETCTIAGIKSNDYLHTNTISIGIINNHINLNVSTLKDVADIGLEDFVWKTNDNFFSSPSKSKQSKIYLRDEAPSFLNLIINLHRSILRLYYVRERLEQAIQLTPSSYRESWLLGMPEGKVIINALRDIVTDANHKHMLALDEVWDAFFTKKYHPYATATHKDASDKVYLNMIAASKYHKDTKQAHTEIVQKLDTFTPYANEAQDDNTASKTAGMTVQEHAFNKAFQAHRVQFNTLIEALETFSSYCSSSHDSTVLLYQPFAQELKTDFYKVSQNFFSNAPIKDKEALKKSFEIFKSDCERLYQKAEKNFGQNTGLWSYIKPILMGFVGVVIAIAATLLTFGITTYHVAKNERLRNQYIDTFFKSESATTRDAKNKWTEYAIKQKLYGNNTFTNNGLISEIQETINTNPRR